MVDFASKHFGPALLGVAAVARSTHEARPETPRDERECLPLVPSDPGSRKRRAKRKRERTSRKEARR